MTTAKMICRVCGKEYDACLSAKSMAGVFRWQEVACSPECGATYLARINESRGITNSDEKTEDKVDTEFPVTEDTSVGDENEPADVAEEVIEEEVENTDVKPRGFTKFNKKYY